MRLFIVALFRYGLGWRGMAQKLQLRYGEWNEMSGSFPASSLATRRSAENLRLPRHRYGTAGQLSDGHCDCHGRK